MSEEEKEKGLLVSDENGEAVKEEDSFAVLMQKMDVPSARFEPGQKVRAKVIGISGDLVYIDVGTKTDGVVQSEELSENGGGIRVRAGDEIEAFFVSVQDGISHFTTKIHGYSAASLNSLRAAYEAGLPVNGEVKREVKGGFEVSAGGVRCFCPFSQIDLKGGREGGLYLGQTFAFKVLEYGENGRNIVVSRRAILDQKRQERLQALKETLTVGAVVTGTIRSIQGFGAFVDLGGIDGLIPVSEIAWGRTEKPEDVLSLGQQVTVKITSLDWDRNRLSLSIKALQPDPWESIVDRYPVESRVTGTIVRLAPFGAFVNMEAGIDGLIHISNLGAGRRINHPKEAVELGQVVEAYVTVVDREKRKLSLSLQPKPKPEKIVLPRVGEAVEGVVERVMPYGVFLRLKSGLTGLIPNAEMGTPGGTDHNRMFASGTDMKAVVIEVDPSKGRVRLSRKEALAKKEQEEFQHYKTSVREKKEPAEKLGSFGELLKAKIEEKKKTDV